MLEVDSARPGDVAELYFWSRCSAHEAADHRESDDQTARMYASPHNRLAKLTLVEYSLVLLQNDQAIRQEIGEAFLRTRRP